jgi:hypothetical protein
MRRRKHWNFLAIRHALAWRPGAGTEAIAGRQCPKQPADDTALRVRLVTVGARLAARTIRHHRAFRSETE